MPKPTLIIAASSFATSNTSGGHYRSASAIASILKETNEVILLNPGSKPALTLQADGIETIFVGGSVSWPRSMRKTIESLLRNRNVHSILAFDVKSGELLRPLARKLDVGLVLVKPGGGQPRLYYPRFDHNIVFTPTDKRWLEARSPYGSQILQAAGRVQLPAQDLAAQQALRAVVGLSKEDIGIIRIGRLSPHYGAVNRSALSLSSRLRAEGLRARLVLIGSKENTDEYNALMAIKGRDDAIICEDRFTDRASKLLGAFRFAIGTGRGFMEAASMGHTLFCGTNDPKHDLPLLVTKANFERFFDDNFSPRIKPDVEPQLNLQRTLEIFKDADKQSEHEYIARAWYREHFSTETARDVYSKSLKHAAHHPERYSRDHLISEIHLRFSVLQDRVRKLFLE